MYDDLYNHIIVLTRRIQHNHRAFYHSRIIEYLADYMRLNANEQIYENLIKFLDAADRPTYENLFRKTRDHIDLAQRSIGIYQ